MTELPHGPLPVGTAVPRPAGEPGGRRRHAGTGPGPGIVAVTGPHLGSGYWDDPQATAAAFTDNGDGTQTYRSSDLGRFDEAGRLHLLGRRDFSVRIGEYLVEPGEVDAALFELPQVREAVTVGTAVAERADGSTHQLVAYLVLHEPGTLDAAAVRELLGGRPARPHGADGRDVPRRPPHHRPRQDRPLGPACRVILTGYRTGSGFLLVVTPLVVTLRVSLPAPGGTSCRPPTSTSAGSPGPIVTRSPNSSTPTSGR